MARLIGSPLMSGGVSLLGSSTSGKCGKGGAPLPRLAALWLARGPAEPPRRVCATASPLVGSRAGAGLARSAGGAEAGRGRTPPSPAVEG